MSRISSAFCDGRKALISFVTVGYPTIEATLGAVPILVQAGSNIIELGIPFSDPLADGATIQKASHEALHNGVTLRTCLDTAARLRSETNTPLVLMGYYNPIFSYGTSRFMRSCAEAGVDGVIVPDLPPEEGRELEESARTCGVDLVYLLAPTSTEDRIRLVAAHSTGFVYLVSVSGVTGARTQLPPDLEQFVQRVRHFTGQPLCVGFGISRPEQASEISRYADGVVVGSKLVQIMETETWQSDLKEFVSGLRKAMDTR